MPLETIANFSIKRLSILDENGKCDTALMPALTTAQQLELYRLMLFTRAFDEKALKLQRQGRIGTYSPSQGQEACVVGSAFALEKQDWTFPSFREHGMFFTRGISPVRTFQFFGGDERGSKWDKEMHILPVSVPVGSQPAHAVGAAIALKLKKSNAITMSYFGDGGTSEGDFHESMNFAGVFNAPTVFINQNNQFAISEPRKIQSASQTLAQKAIAYGIEGIQVDGNDVFAVYKATKEAVDKARAGKGPTLIECVTYRMGDHTTADDSTRYRSKEEVEYWRARDPIVRLQKYLLSAGLLTPALDEKMHADATDAIEKAVVEYEAIPAPSPGDLFDYQFSALTEDLKSQKAELLEFLKNHPPEAKKE